MRRQEPTFFDLMDQVEKAQGHGRRGWKHLLQWCREHPTFHRLPGGIEAAREAARRLHSWRWQKV